MSMPAMVPKSEKSKVEAVRGITKGAEIVSPIENEQENKQ
jgi:hypothetical protein